MNGIVIHAISSPFFITKVSVVSMYIGFPTRLPTPIMSQLSRRVRSLTTTYNPPSFLRTLTAQYPTLPLFPQAQLRCQSVFPRT